ncbi:MAG: hypothetical protein IJS60_10785, partial [Abditibacteriota bacterium]|nr:hypothetical protein [Abditibacteriota bacterium]
LLKPKKFAHCLLPLKLREFLGVASPLLITGTLNVSPYFLKNMGSLNVSPYFSPEKWGVAVS